jgi:hypothetical protein
MTHGRFRSTMGLAAIAAIAFAIAAPSAFAAPKIKTIKIAVTNPGSVARDAEPIVRWLAEL